MTFPFRAEPDGHDGLNPRHDGWVQALVDTTQDGHELNLPPMEAIARRVAEGRAGARA
ncbi:hypothetical protein [Trebonia kvetii]|uniref:hypothetical protein n=1 Tax=Trebonia kvetii TaxID=2480626 RepID=UPI001651F703|nr:hypothetical protein [Trebonia kvetii]